MTTLIITIVILGWIASALVRTADKRSRERHYAAARNRERSFDYRLREAEIETKRLLAESKAETERIIALEKARIEQEKWNAKQEEINRKQEEKNAKFEAQLRKHEFLLEQAASDIDNIAWKIEEAQEYSKYLETERSKCIPGGKEYFKWQNKLSANDDKIYRLTKAMNKAQFTKAEAERKLKEVA